MNGALHGKSARILKQTGDSTVFTAEATTNTGDNKRYKITNAAYAYFDPTATFLVEKSTNAGVDWAEVTTGFYVEFPGGHVVFTAANGAADLVRIGGKYFAMADWGAMINWKLEENLELIDMTNFTSGEWKEFFPSLRDFSGSCGGYWLDGSEVSLLPSVGTPTHYLFSLYTDYGASKKRFDGYGIVKKVGVELAVKDLVKDSLDFTVSRVYYREG